MGKIIRRVVLDGDLKAVWEFITHPKNFSAYVHGYAGGKTISQNETGTGARYEWQGMAGPFKLRSIEQVVKWHDRQQVAYRGIVGGVPFSSSMTVRKTKKQTQLTVSIRYEVPFYLGGVITDMLLIRWVIKSHIKKSLEALREIRMP